MLTPLKPAPGALLIAPPMLPDTHFHRTAVLLCEHGHQGSFGLILNQPLTIPLDEVIDELPGYTAPLSLGGPVQQDTVHYLHRFGPRVPGSIEVLPNLAWGGDFETLMRVTIDEGSAAAVRFFLGYAGWSPGQLQGEIDDEGWIVTDADVDLVFSDPPEGIWRQALRRMGGTFAMLSNFPSDPRLN
ncbi:MAG: YqgE/AlgH family protein [Bacteroidota bacterium]